MSYSATEEAGDRRFPLTLISLVIYRPRRSCDRVGSWHRTRRPRIQVFAPIARRRQRPRVGIHL